MPNAAPIALADAYSVHQGQVLQIAAANGVLANDTDADNDPLTAVLVANGSHGGATLFNDGSFSYSANAGYVGTDIISYKPNDGTVDGNTVDVTINVTNTSPSANNDWYSVHQGQSLNVSSTSGVLANDSDADGDSLTSSVVSNVSHGTLTPFSDGGFNYLPNDGYVGVDSFTYEANDGAGDSSTVTVAINVANEAPFAQSRQFWVHSGQILSLDSTSGILHDAYDSDGDAMVVEQVGAGPNNPLALNADGSFTYQAITGFQGDDTFSYRISDGAAFSATQVAAIHVVDQAPSATVTSFDVWYSQGIYGAANVLSNATDPENDSLTADLVTGPGYADSFGLNPDGTFWYLPTANPPQAWDGHDSFSIRAFDGTLYSAAVTMNLNVSATPISKDDSYFLGQANELSISAANGVLANEFNPMGAGLTAEVMQGVDPAVGTLDFNEDGSFVFTKGPNFQDQATFTYRTLVQIGNIVAPGPVAVVRLAASAAINSTTQLWSVGFDGNARIKPDVGGPYESPQWRAAFVGGDRRDDERRNPISFTRNTSIGLTPTFDINENTVAFWRALGQNVLVRADSNQFTDAGERIRLGYSQNIHLRVAQLDDWDILTTQGVVRMDSALPDYTDYFPLLELTWSVSPDGGVTWVPLSRGTSNNQTFVTLANPVGGDVVPLSVFFVGVEGANGNGAANEAALVADVWSGFTTRNITAADGTQLQYWANWNGFTNNLAPLVTTADLLQNANGQCNSWAALFTDVLRAWGNGDITIANQKRINTRPGTTDFGINGASPTGGFAFNQFLVGNWQLGQPNIAANNVPILQGYTNYFVLPVIPDSDPPRPYSERLVDGEWRFVWDNPSIDTPTPAQNTPNPRPIFQNHVVVRIGNTLYDPSYGVTYAYDPNNPVADFASRALGAMVTMIAFDERADFSNFDLNGDGQRTFYWVALFKPVNAAHLQMT